MSANNVNNTDFSDMSANSSHTPWQYSAPSWSLPSAIQCKTSIFHDL